ncbi:MAG: methyl-accepting chemotaxis protein [Gammaproteobacteria bacterium]
MQGSLSRVRNGADLVNESGVRLEEIVKSVKNVGEIIAEIAAASHEQAAGIDQVNKVVTGMDELTQQNAALAEEASADSVAMNEHAGAMVDRISFFKT